MERAVYDLARHLEARGVETLLLTRSAVLPGTFPGAVKTVPYGGFPAGRHGSVLDRTLNYPRFARRLGQAVAERVRAGEVDVVHAQGLTALGYARLREKDGSLRAPLVMNPQGMEEHKTTGLKRLALARLRALSREAARLADRVLATDEATRDEVPRLLGVPDSRVVVLPNAIDPEEIQRLTPVDARGEVLSAWPALAEAAPVFLSVGRLHEYKGFNDIVASLERLAARSALPSRWAWVVVGEGPLRDVLGRARTRLGESHVILAGGVGDPLLHALYARADVFVHAPRYEGSSLVTLEAMAHGLPAVATHVGGIPDKVLDGETGRLVSPGDPAGLARALEELARDAPLRARLGEEGRRRALAHFTWERVAEKTIALYEDLLRRAGTTGGAPS